MDAGDNNIVGGGTTHVYPVNDLCDHILDVGCACCPSVLYTEDGSYVVAHNSFDGREGLEQAKEILDAL